MSVNVPAQLEQAIQQKAEERRVTVDRLVVEALEWYLRMGSCWMSWPRGRTFGTKPPSLWKLVRVT